MKLSIIAEGGALRGAYAAGAVYAIHKHFGLKRVDYVTGSSSSIATLAYYTAGQADIGMNIWRNELSNHRFLSFRNMLRGKPFLNVDYLIDEVFKKRIPLDENNVKSSKMKLITPLTNTETGEAEYFDNTSTSDFFEVLRATMAVPYVYDRSVKINGQEYFDGSFSDPLPLGIQEIKDSRKIIILTKPRNGSKNLMSDALMYKFFKLKFKPSAYNSLKLKSFVYQKRLDEVKELEANGDVVISPSNKISRFDNKAESIKKNIEQGYQDATSNKKLIDLIKSLKNKN